MKIFGKRDNDLYEDFEASFFTEFDTLGRPYHRSQLEGHWCNCGHQISIGPDGTFYPCNRFHPISLANQKRRTIGNVDDGIDFDKLRPFRVLRLGTCSSSRCIECDVAMGCGMCSGLSYDESEIGTVFSRTEYNCLMHKARIRVNEYYWDRLAKEQK
jgi:radical SAM protein with 4Fe4S-binding SPASM domain